MVIDSSAIIAILLKEPEAEVILEALTTTSLRPCIISAPTLLETRMVIYGRRKENGLVDLNGFLKRSDIAIIPFTSDLADIAFDAHKRYNKPPSRLNFGDCFSYALAKSRNEALLCKGNDFKHTDISIVDYQ